MSSASESAVERADALGRTQLAGLAAAIDRGESSARDGLNLVIGADLAGLRVPEAYGGAGLSDTSQLRALEGLAYGDGTTAFVIAQHYGASALVAHGHNDALKEDVLPRLARGEILAGFGISQLRRAGTPAVAASPAEGGYLCSGAIPWATGRGLLDSLVIGGTLPDGFSLLAWVPFAAREGMTLGEPIALVAMNGANTVPIQLDRFFVPNEAVVAIEPAGRRMGANRTAVPCLFGIARACIDDLRRRGEERGVPMMADAAERLAARLEDARQRFYGDVECESATEAAERRLAEARAEAMGLALDGVAALTVALAGGANSLTSPAQRRLREISVFSTWGLSQTATAVALETFSHARRGV